MGCLVKAVDTAKGTITFAIGRGRGENPEEKTLPVAKNARITIDGNDGKLVDIKVEERGPFAQLGCRWIRKVCRPFWLDADGSNIRNSRQLSAIS